VTETIARAPQAEPSRHGPTPPIIPGPLDVARAAWRRLRRMSTALALLFALAAAAVVATFVPQEPVIAETVAAWRAGVDAAGQPAGPGQAIAAFFDVLGFFDVFGSWWFTTLLVLLLVSLTGCLIPRYRAFARLVRRPPAAGRDLERLTAHEVLTTDLPPAEALAAADRVLRRRRFRRRLLDAEAGPTGSAQLAAERGHWREGGSLLFHTAFYLLLVGIVIGHTLGFTGQVNVVEGAAFVDTRLSYDASTPGRFFGLGSHSGFRATLDDFEASYHPDLTPSDFVSRVTIEGAEGTRSAEVRVNHPVSVDGMKLYQMRFGMAPRVVVRTADGSRVLHDAPVLMSQSEQDPNQFTGVAKVPVGGDDVPEMALELALLPDAALTDDGRPYSRSPRADNPVLFANVYVGDLGLERPVPPSELLPTWSAQDIAGQVVLGQGEEAAVGGDLVVEFADLRAWSGFQVSRQPGRGILLLAAGLLLAGLVPSLYAYRRRIWVTARDAGSGSEVVLAGAALQRSATFSEEFRAVADDLRGALPTTSREPDG
jgi:cytochrome c biogenesis protein